MTTFDADADDRNGAGFDARTASAAVPLLRLVPQSGIQFVDLTLSTAELGQTRKSFTEHRFAVSGSQRTVLMPLERSTSGDGIVWHPVTHRALAPSEIMSITGFAALEAFVGTWVPLPILRYLGTDETGRPNFDAGPENWARVFVSAVAGDIRDADSIALAVAFDTRLDGVNRGGESRYLAPNAEDVLLGSTFKFSASGHDLTQFVSRPWIDAWLRSTLDVFRGRSAEPAPRHAFELEHVARYLAFIDVLDRFCAWPELRFVDTLSRRWPVPTTDVDLVLDLGSQETAALVVDHAAGGPDADMTSATSLVLRDLSNPAIRHHGPIPTRVEFASQPFGVSGLSRLSGRPDAFLWSSLVRAGREAERLALAATATEGVTGHSALTALMTETAPQSEDWRIGSEHSAVGNVGPLVSGALLAHLAQDGTLLGSGGSGSGSAPAIRPRFATASLLTFFIGELLLHAVAQINAPDMVPEPRRASGVRQLKRLVITAPAAMSPAERASITSHAEQAIALAWRAMGWDTARDVTAPQPPAVVMGLGSDLAAQLFVVRREMAARFDNDMRELLEFTSRQPDAHGNQVVRVASVDFGNALSGVLVVDYMATPDGHLAPMAGTADRWSCGEEAVLGEIARQFVLPAITAELSDSGVANADLVLASSLDTLTSRDSRDRALARRLQTKVIRPAAAALLGIARDLPAHIASGQRTYSLRYLVELGGGRLDPDARTFETIAARFGAGQPDAGAAGFKLGAVQVRLSQRQLSASILGTVSPVIANIAAVSRQHEFDLLLVSGDLASIPAVTDELYAEVSLEPARIVLTSMRDGPATSGDDARAVALPPARIAGIAGAYLASDNAAGLDAFRRVAREIGNQPLLLSYAADDDHANFGARLVHPGAGLPPAPPPAAGFGLRAATGDDRAIAASRVLELERGVEP